MNGNTNSNKDNNMLNLASRLSSMTINPISQFNSLNFNTTSNSNNNLISNEISNNNCSQNQSSSQLHDDLLRQQNNSYLSQQLFNFDTKVNSSDLETLDSFNFINPSSSTNSQALLNQDGQALHNRYNIDDNLTSLNSTNLASFVKDNVVVQSCEISNDVDSDKTRFRYSSSKDKQERQRERCETPEIVNSIQEQLLCDEI